MSQQDHSVQLRPKLVGKRVKRTEDPRLLTGVGQYVDDMAPARMLHIALRRSDQPHARILNIDVGDAFSVPGVVAIYDASDLEGEIKPAISTSRMPGYYATPLWPLARGKVRYVGEPVVAIVAESRYAAEDALEHISIKYEPLPFAINAVKDDAPLLHEEAGTNTIIRREFKRGDVDAAFQGCSGHRERQVPDDAEDRGCHGEPVLSRRMGEPETIAHATRPPIFRA
ncbi:putative dehydrogenase (plasmid) [Rhizobium sp. CCGE 510]|nr:putative dehydrogenase [Rhizobium sp. CCGE 510]